MEEKDESLSAVVHVQRICVVLLQTSQKKRKKWEEKTWSEFVHSSKEKYLYHFPLELKHKSSFTGHKTWML
jgi:hypothetical protein